MDHLPQRYLHFPFISNWQMKGFVLLLKEFQAFAQSGGRRLFWAKGVRAKTLELLVLANCPRGVGSR